MTAPKQVHSQHRRRGNLYAYVDQGRHGLGNLLFPWARAEVFCHEQQARMLAVPWTQWLRIGPWLRGERDRRYYIGLFSNAQYIRGMAKWYLQLRLKTIPEDQFDGVPQGASRLVVFHGMQGGFEPFKAHRDLVRRRLLSILHPRLRSGILRAGEPSIGVHIRRGDFTAPPTAQDIRKISNVQLPDEFYIAGIEALRTILGPQTPVVVYSDGTPEQLQVYQSMHKLTIAPPAPSIVDILRLAQSRVIIGSASSFSKWACFLGDTPSLWFPGKKPCPSLASSPGAEVELLEDTPLPESFATIVQSHHAWNCAALLPGKKQR